MRGDIKLGRFFGIDIKLHFSWWVIVIFLVWVLASQFFPLYYPELTTMEHWLVASICTILLFVSVLLHELSHSFVAKKKGINVHSITLFFFGGVADIESEDMKPMDEFLMAIAGPLSSFFLAGICAIIFLNTTVYLIPNAIAYYLFQLNIVLGIFNLVPGYPLDGGRALRAILHHFIGDLRKATRIASWGGKAFATVLIVLGIFQLFSGALGGLWLIFIGIFLHFVAGLSYEQVIFYDILSKWKVSEFQVKAKTNMMIKGDTNFQDFLQSNLSNKHKTFIVKKGKEAVAILDLTTIAAMRNDDLSKLKVNDIAIPLKKLGTLTPDQSAYLAFKKFLESGSRILSVKKTMESEKIDGLVFKEQVMNALVRRLKFGVNFKNQKTSNLNIKVSKKALKDAKAVLSGKQKKSKQKNSKKKVTSKKRKVKKKVQNKNITSLPIPKLPSD